MKWNGLKLIFKCERYDILNYTYVPQWIKKLIISITFLKCVKKMLICFNNQPIKRVLFYDIERRKMN